MRKKKKALSSIIVSIVTVVSFFTSSSASAANLNLTSVTPQPDNAGINLQNDSINRQPPEGKFLLHIYNNTTIESTYDTMYDQDFYQKIKNNYDNYSETNPLRINSAGKLAAFAKFVNEDSDTSTPPHPVKHDFKGKLVMLTDDIDLGGALPAVSYDPDEQSQEIFNVNISETTKNVWVPIGKSKNINFAGTFDGAGHKIKNMVVNQISSSSEIYAGLFGYVDGGTIINVDITGNSAVITSSTAYHSYSYAGGIVGYANNSTIRNCYNTGFVFAYALFFNDSRDSNAYSGGIVADAGSNSTISNCYNTGAVFASAECTSGGGIVANAYDGSTVNNCYNTGSVYVYAAVQADAGGIAGNASKSTINNCYNTGSTSARASGCDKSSAGGIAGDVFNYATITYCYSAASSTLGFNEGGLVAWTDNISTIENCYYDTKVSGPKKAISEKSSNEFTALFPADFPSTVKGLTTSEMISSSTMAGFAEQTYTDTDGNSKTVWNFDNTNYPRLNILVSKTKPSISLANDTLTVDTSTVPEGAEPSSLEPNYIYTWKRDGNVISTGNSYALTSEDKSKVISCTISADNYIGDVTLNFKPSASIEQPMPVEYNGTDQTPTLIVKFGDNKLEENNDYTVTWTNSAGSNVTSLINTDTYTATVTFVDDIPSETINFTINKATPHPDVPDNLKAIYGQTLRDVELPSTENGRWSWFDSEETSVGDIGTNVFTGIFTPNDTENYKIANAQLQVTVEVDKSDWGTPKEVNGLTMYVKENGETSVEVTGYDIIWLLEESDGTSAWYGIDNRQAVFKIGSRAYVHWLSARESPERYNELWNNIDEAERQQIEDDNGWIFEVGVVRPDGIQYSNLEKPTNLYVQIGDDWDKEDLQGLYIRLNGTDDDINVTFVDNQIYPDGTDTFGVMSLKHFSPYLIYDELTKESSISSPPTGDQMAIMIISTCVIVLIISFNLIIKFILKKKNK